MITWIDIMILVILLICVVLGTIRGVMKTIFAVAKLVVSAVVAKMASPVISAWIIGHTPIVTKIQEIFARKGAMPQMNDAVSDSLSGATIWFNSLNIGNVPNKIITFFANLWDKAASAAGGAGSTVLDITANSIVNFLTFVIVFWIAMLILTIIANALEVMEKLPVIKTMNRTGGFILGLLRGLFINVVIVSIFFVLAMFLTGSPINTALQNSILAPYFYIGYIFL